MYSLRAFIAVFGVASIGAAVRPAVAAESSAANVAVTAHVAARTSLKVSGELLSFTVPDGSNAAVASVEFLAAARTAARGDVVLTVEAMRATAGPGGSADVDTAVVFTGEGEGTTDGELRTSGVAVAGRWTGSGVRSGRLTFTLRAPTPGTYRVPVRFVLSLP